MRTSHPSATVDKLCSLELQRRFLEQRAEERAAAGQDARYSLRAAEALAWLIDLFADSDEQSAADVRDAIARADEIQARRGGRP